MSTALAELPLGVYAYRMNASSTSEYGQITYENRAANVTPEFDEGGNITRTVSEMIMEEDVFKYILQKCKYYKDVIFDHESMRVEGWDYGGDNWNGTEFPNHAPTCHLIKPFYFRVENGPTESFKVSVFVDPTEYKIGDNISTNTDVILPHTLLQEREGGVQFDQCNGVEDQIEIIREIATHHGWDHIVNKEILGILNILSHFADKNVYNGTKNVWTDEVGIDCSCCIENVWLTQNWNEETGELLTPDGVCVRVHLRCNIDPGTTDIVRGIIYWNYGVDNSNQEPYILGRNYHNIYDSVGCYKVRLEIWDRCHMFVREIELCK